MFPDRSPLNELNDPAFEKKHPRLYAKLVDLKKRGFISVEERRGNRA